MPAWIASRGLCRRTRWPRTWISGAAGVRPNRAWKSSRWPCPSSPPMPNISPACSDSDTPFKPGAVSSVASSSTSSSGCSSGSAYAVDISRPLISLTASSSASSSRMPTSVPLRNTVIRSARSVTSLQRCEVNTTHEPLSRRRRTRPNNHSTSRLESAEVGSSRISTAGSRITARTISISCCWASGNCSTSSPGSTESTSCSASSSAAAAGSSRRRISPRPPRGSRPINRFSATVIWGSSVSSWNTVATPRRKACSGERSSTSSPPIDTCPSSGRIMPASALIIVLLPAPFSPTSAWTSPRAALNVASSSASTPP